MSTTDEPLEEVKRLEPIVESNWMKMEADRTLPAELVVASTSRAYS